METSPLITGIVTPTVSLTPIVMVVEWVVLDSTVLDSVQVAVVLVDIMAVVIPLVVLDAIDKTTLVQDQDKMVVVEEDVEIMEDRHITVLVVVELVSMDKVLMELLVMLR